MISFDLVPTAKEVEKSFIRAVEEAGLIVEPAPAIRCQEPVMDRCGEVKKTVTLPDCFVRNPRDNRNIHVEITKGNGDNPHKKAQRRVVKAAQVDNYIQVTGDQIAVLFSLVSPELKRQFLEQLFGW